MEKLTQTLSKDEYDAEIKRLKEAYEGAKLQYSAEGMKEANDTANTIRKQNTVYGDAAQDASQDIANMEAKVNAIKATQTPSASSVGGISSTASGIPLYQSSTLPTTTDYTSYIDELYNAQQEAALAELESAYNNNLASLDQAEANIDSTYESARNQTAGTNEQEKRNFAEYAAANGLNSGTSGQAELARSVTLQNNLNSLNQNEASAYSEITLQRTQLANEYNAAIASAKADGNYELANALYREKVRVDESLLNTALNQESLNYQAYQANYQSLQDEQSKAETEKEKLASYGALYLQNGIMPSDAMLEAMNLEKDDAQKFIDGIYGG